MLTNSSFLCVSAHPIHAHLVHFEIVGDFTFTYEVDGKQILTLHNGGTGVAPRISSVSSFSLSSRSDEYYDDAPKDMVTVLPGDPDQGIGRGTIVRAEFSNKVGRYVWHCHILRYANRSALFLCWQCLL